MPPALDAVAPPSEPPPPGGPPPLLSRWLAGLCALAGLAAAQALWLPRWPRVQELPAAPLRAALAPAGWRPLPAAALPAQRSSELALSPVLSWQLPSGERLSLVQAAVRRRDNFQVAYLSRPHPQLRLSGRRRDQPSAGSDAGRNDGQPAVQTCLVSQPAGLPRAATTALELGRAADRRVQGLPARIRALLGLQSTRSFSCLLVTLRSSSTHPLPQGLWQDLLALLQRALQAADAR